MKQKSLEEIVGQSSENPQHPSFLRRLYDWSSDYINYKTGAAAGVIGGGIVYYINHDYGFWPAAGGFAKQLFYNVFIAGFNIKTCEKLSQNITSKTGALLASTIIPTAQAFAIMYGIHKFGGTPEAYDSTIWQVYVNLPLFLGLGLLYRKRQDSIE